MSRGKLAPIEVLAKSVTIHRKNCGEIEVHTQNDSYAVYGWDSSCETYFLNRLQDSNGYAYRINVVLDVESDFNLPTAQRVSAVA